MRDFAPVINLTRGTVVCERVALADRPLQRMKGLLGQSSLQAGDGLLLRPAPSIHTAFMRFPIDVVFLDRECVVVRSVGSLPPWRAASARGARSALELAAGQIVERAVHIGDRLVHQESANGGATHLSEETQDGGTYIPQGCGDELSLDALPASQRARESEAGGSKLLLVSSDRRFRAVMHALLSARGFSVTLSTGHTGIPTAANQSGADVVVIDVADSAAGEQALIQASLMAPDLAVVVVSDGNQEVAGSGRVIRKWEPLEGLCAEIELARAEALEGIQSRASATHGTTSGGIA